MNANPDELINRWREGSLSDEEMRQLTDTIATQEGRAALRGDWFLEAALPEALRTSPVLKMTEEMRWMVAPQRKRWSGWLQWRPLTAAAAGLVIGLCSASMVWAYAVRQQSTVLLAEGFEASPEIARQNFPDKTGQWSVAGGKVVGAEGGVSPKEGRRMLLMEPKAKEKSTRAHYVVDLRAFPQLGAGARQQFDFRAAFHPAVAGKTDRYLLRAAAFADDLGSVDMRWMLDEWGEVQDHSLASAARCLNVSPGTHGWENLSLTIDVPPGARILVLSVWTATMEEKREDRGAHYVDDIRLSCFTKEPLP